MAYSPKEIEDLMDNTIALWEAHSSDKTYGGVTLDEMKEAAAQAKKPRRRLEKIAAERRAEIGKRKSCDKIFLKKRAMLIAGIIADPEEGEDSVFYGSFGYVRKSKRKSGLTRKKKKGANGNNQ